jgi:hypothetical protein
VLLLVGAMVLVLQVQIPEPFALAAEFAVSAMLCFWVACSEYGWPKLAPHQHTMTVNSMSSA